MRRQLRLWCASHQVAPYFLLAFTAAWLVWLPMVGCARGLLEFEIPDYFVWAAGLGPIQATTIVEWIVQGREGLRSLYGWFLVPGIPLRWHTAASALPADLVFVSVWLQQLTLGRSIALASPPWPRWQS